MQNIYCNSQLNHLAVFDCMLCFIFTELGRWVAGCRWDINGVMGLYMQYLCSGADSVIWIKKCWEIPAILHYYKDLNKGSCEVAAGIWYI